MSKKNLDKLFQEKFSSFQESPDSKVWQTIEASLNQKDKKRRIIPLWWQIGSIAAILVLGLFLINPFTTTETISPSVITDTENPEKILKDKRTSIENEIKKVNSQETETTKIAEINSNSSSSEQNLTLKPSKNGNTPTPQNVVQHTTAIATNDDSKEKEHANKQINTSKNKEKTNTLLSLTPIENTIAQGNQKKETISTEKLHTTNQVEKVLEKSQKTVNTIAVINEKQNTAKEKEKKSIYDEIEAQKTEKKEEAIANTKPNKWSAGASIAPVYFNALGEGSPVSEMFVSNSKSGETNLSYGLSIAYEVSNKLSIRSGIHKVDYAYNTNNVRFSSNFNGRTNQQISTINYDSSSSNLEILSASTEALTADSPKEKFVANDVLSSKSPTRDGVMSQQFDYLEVPLELKYQLVDSKFGVDLIGGVSSLFLLDNSVLLSSGSITTTLGEANNMNSINFSTNIGLGLNYKFTSKIKINVEPMFKYQLNTFSNTEGTFEPYSIGVYSGLTFKF
ncbi:hypothetical protein [uncultured Maribacter sp.]|uniref:hypothetical protein n=1 Tax=uncultured Maribacter sp. TaxID=431308 RepID=UPI00260ACF1D|nr:hypothetical protein [uncultured Maribacter sp.]